MTPPPDYSGALLAARRLLSKFEHAGAIGDLGAAAGYLSQAIGCLKDAQQSVSFLRQRKAKQVARLEASPLKINGTSLAALVIVAGVLLAGVAFWFVRWAIK